MRLHGWIFLVLQSAAVALAGQTAVARADCPILKNLPPLQVEVQLLKPKIVYHRDIDLFGLPRIQHGTENPPPGATLFGLTKEADSFVVEFRRLVLPVGDRFCVWVTKVDAKLGNPVMDVYIAADYATDSCEYRETLAHENTHVRFNLEALHDWLPKIRTSLTDSAKQNFPAFFAAAPTTEELNHVLLDPVAPVFAQMNADMAGRNASIDTPENYRRVIARCHDWMRPEPAQ